MKPLTQIIFVDSLDGRTPAMVNRKSGVMYIDRKFWNRLKTEHRFFVLLHEYAHAELNTRDEFEADNRAFELYVQFGYSITESIHALTRVLSYDTQEHTARTIQLIHTARKYDKNKSKAVAYSGGVWYKQFYNK